MPLWCTILLPYLRSRFYSISSLASKGSLPGRKLSCTQVHGCTISLTKAGSHPACKSDKQQSASCTISSRPGLQSSLRCHGLDWLPWSPYLSFIEFITFIEEWSDQARRPGPAAGRFLSSQIVTWRSIKYRVTMSSCNWPNNSTNPFSFDACDDHLLSGQWQFTRWPPQGYYKSIE